MHKVVLVSVLAGGLTVGLTTLGHAQAVGSGMMSGPVSSGTKKAKYQAIAPQPRIAARKRTLPDAEVTGSIGKKKSGN